MEEKINQLKLEKQNMIEKAKQEMRDLTEEEKKRGFAIDQEINNLANTAPNPTQLVNTSVAIDMGSAPAPVSAPVADSMPVEATIPPAVIEEEPVTEIPDAPVAEVMPEVPVVEVVSDATPAPASEPMTVEEPAKPAIVDTPVIEEMPVSAPVAEVPVAPVVEVAPEVTPAPVVETMPEVPVVEPMVTEAPAAPVTADVPEEVKTATPAVEPLDEIMAQMNVAPVVETPVMPETVDAPVVEQAPSVTETSVVEPMVADAPNVTETAVVEPMVSEPVAGTQDMEMPSVDQIVQNAQIPVEEEVPAPATNNVVPALEKVDDESTIITPTVEAEPIKVVPEATNSVVSEIGSETPVVETPAEPVAAKPQKKSKLKSFLIAILFIILLGLGGVLIYFNMV